MSSEIALPTVNAWTVFWAQLPALILVVAVIIVTTTALRRARPEDVPLVFKAFASLVFKAVAAAFGRRAGRRASQRRTDSNEAVRNGGDRR